MYQTHRYTHMHVNKINILEGDHLHVSQCSANLGTWIKSAEPLEEWTENINSTESTSTLYADFSMCEAPQISYTYMHNSNNESHKNILRSSIYFFQVLMTHI